MALSIYDALMQSKTGETLVVQTKAAKKEVADRIKSLKGLAHFTFVEYPRSHGLQTRFDVYNALKEPIRTMGEDGGEDYERLCNLLDFAHTSKQVYEHTIELVSSFEHCACDYESSDGYSRYY